MPLLENPLPPTWTVKRIAAEAGRLLVSLLLSLWVYYSLTVLIYFVIADGDPFYAFIGNAVMIILAIATDILQPWELGRRFWAQLTGQPFVPKELSGIGGWYRSLYTLVPFLYIFYAIIIVANQVANHYPDWPLYLPGLLYLNTTFGDIQSYFATTQASLLLLLALEKAATAVTKEYRTRKAAGA